MRSDREIGDRLRRLRGDMPQKVVLRRLKALGVSMPELAISRIENGERSLKFSEALGLAVVYNVSIDGIALDSPRDSTQLARTNEHRRVLRELELVRDGINEKIEKIERDIHRDLEVKTASH
ncbi:MAG: hypothetical protein JWP10_1506 [Nocardioidaceae bacterium]|nr:hypothetical protein [Nocardioidaceae bacterium]